MRVKGDEVAFETLRVMKDMNWKGREWRQEDVYWRI